MSSHLIIFDFDGVIADSEVLANAVLAEAITELGVPTTLNDAYHLYMGKRFIEIIAAIETAIGRNLPATFQSEVQERTFDRFRAQLQPVYGVRAFIRQFPDQSKCIASSSSPGRLSLCLDLVDLKGVFGDHVFSASNVARGKPHPDIFLHAAEKMGSVPGRAIVLEDSVTGVLAAKAAGMTVIGLLAASHIQSDHGDKLKAAGADFVAPTFVEASAITRDLLSERA